MAKLSTKLMQRRTGLDEPVLFKDIREQKVVFAIIIAYYWKLYVNSVEVASPNLAGVC